MVLGLACLAILAPGLWWGPRWSQRGSAIRHVLLISIDTCRADHLSCCGYPRATTPHLDELAGRGVLFRNAISPVPLTLPAHSSMLTGTIPPQHGVHNNSGYRLAESSLTLAEILAAAGFTTGAVVSSFVLDSQFGLAQGFDTYDDRFQEGHKALNISERRGDEITRIALEWLEKQQGARAFLFLHYFDPHYDYVPPEPFASKFADSPYAGEIAYTDHCIGRVLSRLRELDMYDSTLILVAGDHGEMLGEHGEGTHGYFIYQAAIRVPLIIKLPGHAAARLVDDPAGLVDIVPTVCSLLGLEIPRHVQGRDLSPLLAGKRMPDADRHLYCESTEATRYGANALLGVVTSRFKYVQTARPELHDLPADPGEIGDLAASEPERSRTLQDRLRATLERAVPLAGSDGQAAPDAEAARRLESLGYAGGRREAGLDFDRDREDPKDLIGFHSRLGDAFVLHHQKRHEQARRLYQELLARRPRFPEPQVMLARIAAEQGDLDRAVARYREALRIDPTDSAVQRDLGIALVRQQRLDEAVACFTEALRLDPEAASSHHNLGVALLEQGKADLAIGHFEQALALKPASPDTQRELGAALLARGQVDESVRHYQESLRLEPDQPAVLHALAWLRATHADDRVREPRQAVELARRAGDLTGHRNPLILQALAAAQASAGDFAHAVSTAEKALELASSAGQTELAAEIRRNQAAYAAGRPWREAPRQGAAAGPDRAAPGPWARPRTIRPDAQSPPCPAGSIRGSASPAWTMRRRSAAARSARTAARPGSHTRLRRSSGSASRSYRQRST